MHLLTYPLWLLSHIFQSEKLRSFFIHLNQNKHKRNIAGLKKVDSLDASHLSDKNLDSLRYNKKPLLLKGLMSQHLDSKNIDHNFLIENFPTFKTKPRIGNNEQIEEQTLVQILKNKEEKLTIASNELTQEPLLEKTLEIKKRFPKSKIFNSPLLNHTLFVSSKGFYTRLHMEAGRLLNIQLSGSKTWYLIDPQYSHILRPLLSDTTIHFSDVVKSIEDIEEVLAKKIPIYTCTLEKGDVLLVPPFYWHTVFCEKDAVSGTFQWLTLFKPFFENPFLSLFLLTSRNPSLWDVLYKKKKGKKGKK